MSRSRTADWIRFISVDPEVCHGKPCFKGTRIMVPDILELLGAGVSAREIRLDFPRLTKGHIQAALQFARDAVQEGRFVPFLSARHASAGR
jgi:uncharacterized protein (DUF433 family)